MKFVILCNICKSKGIYTKYWCGNHIQKIQILICTELLCYTAWHQRNNGSSQIQAYLASYSTPNCHYAHVPPVHCLQLFSLHTAPLQRYFTGVCAQSKIQMGFTGANNIALRGFIVSIVEYLMEVHSAVHAEIVQVKGPSLPQRVNNQAAYTLTQRMTKRTEIKKPRTDV